MSAAATESFEALGTTAVVSVTDEGSLSEARELLARDLAAVDLACSRFRDDSELVHANACAGTPVRIGSLLADAVRVALDAARSSNGLVDPTLGANLRAAGYDRTFSLVQERGTWQIQAPPARRASWGDVDLDDQERMLLIPAGVELDLGATAKAWASDRAAARIAEATGCGVLVSVGGDVAVAGPAPSGGWSIRIADDQAAALDVPGPVVAITTGGLATSGVAVRRWATDQGEAHHLIDPRTGRPAVTPWRTVSVAAASCVAANTVSTGAIVLGEDATAWLLQRGLPARAVRRDGSVLTVCGWPAEAEAA
ncbi:MAG TPA: FAD:protein FMN transferase [Gaiellaceae bacterium]